MENTYLSSEVYNVFESNIFSFLIKVFNGSWNNPFRREVLTQSYTIKPSNISNLTKASISSSIATMAVITAAYYFYSREKSKSKWFKYE